MNIAYISSFDPKNIKSWSGIGYYLAQILEKSGHNISYIAPLYDNGGFLAKVRQQFYKSVLGKKHLRNFDPTIVRGYAQQIQDALKTVKADVLFSVWNLPIAELETEIPISFTADAVFSLMKDFYPDWSNITEKSKINGNSVDVNALARSAAAIYCSQWAADEAIIHHKTDKRKVHVVPYGANIDSSFIPKTEEAIRNKIGNKCSLLFLGVDWIRKGGDIAYNTMKELNAMGVNASLIVCGCVPPVQVQSDKNVDVIPFLNKSIPNDLTRLIELLRTSSFLLLPTRAEAYGIVFCEASAFGLPSISTSVGGVPTAVKHGINGHLLPFSATGKEYAETIAELWNSPDTYYKLSQTSRIRYEDELNWDAAGKRILSILESIV